MALELVNPSNGARKSTIPFLWCALFGGFYFIVHGIWKHVFIWLLVLPTIIGFFIYPFLAKRILKHHYEDKGWVEETEYKQRISDGTAPSTWIGARKRESKPIIQVQNKEVIKIKCRSCGSLNNEHSKFCSNCGGSL
jgi:hypothetical protein